MSKKLILSTALGVLSCVMALGCCHSGACGGGCSTCGSHGYPASGGYGPEYAGVDEDQEEVAQRNGVRLASHKQHAGCSGGSCSH